MQFSDALQGLEKAGSQLGLHDTETESGNGGTYDGKLRVLHHYVDQFQCEGKNRPESILIRTDGDNWVQIKNIKEKCAVVDQEPVTGVVYDDVTKQALFEGKIYVQPKPYLVDANEDPNLVDVKPLDGVCADVNGKCSLLASLQSAEVASYNSGIDVTLPAADFKLVKEMRLVSGPNGHPIGLSGESPVTTILDGQGTVNILRLFGAPGSGPVTLQNMKFANGFLSSSMAAKASALENNLPASLFVSNGIFEGNVGEDVFQATSGSGDVSLTKTRFLNNSPKYWVLQFPEMANSHLILNEVEISNNTIGVAGGAVLAAMSTNDGVGLTVQKSLIYRTVNGCALYLNHVAEALIENTTIYYNDNQAIDIMSADPASRSILVRNSTLVQNGKTTGWGPSNIYTNIADSAQMLEFVNSIVTSADPKVPNCFVFGRSIVANNSFMGDTTCQEQGFGNYTGDPHLAPLADNGGFTRTMMPLSGSYAIDTGGSDVTCSAVDQRGAPRPVDKLGAGPRCDIGAVEVQ